MYIRRAFTQYHYKFGFLNVHTFRQNRTFCHATSCDAFRNTRNELQDQRKMIFKATKKNSIFLQLHSYIHTSVVMRTNEPTKIVDPSFVDLGLGDGWFLNSYIQLALEKLHLFTEVPWWISIVACTVAIRITLFPFFIINRRTMVNQVIHQEKTMELSNAVEKAKASKNVMWRVQAQKKLQKHYKTHGIAPIKFAYGIVEPIVFMSWITALRQMCNVPLPSFAEGGYLWFSNLLIPDSTLVLPITASLLTTAAFYTSLRANNAIQNKFVKIGLFSIPTIVTLTAYLQLPPFGTMPAALILYWCTNACYTLTLVTTMNIPAVRSALKIPRPNRKPKIGADGKPKSIFDTAKARFAENKLKAQQTDRERAFAKKQKQKIKDLKKKDPPKTFPIGHEAVQLKKNYIDFEIDTRPPKPDIFK